MSLSVWANEKEKGKEQVKIIKKNMKTEEKRFNEN